MKEEIVSENNGKPAFDEQTLARVLEAAYVLQEHNREQREREARMAQPRVVPMPVAEPAPPRPVVADSPSKFQPASRSAKDDYSVVMRQIVETQQQIQTQRMELESAMTLIVGRAAEIAQADGAAIGILDRGKVRYRAGAGLLAPLVGTEVLMEKALCTACLRIGQVVRCGDVNLEFLVDLEECRRRGIQSMIAAPVYQRGNVVGALELFYRNSQAFSEPDVHTCQLMAGLVSEVMARSAEVNSIKSLETERAAMRDALQTLKPNLEALADRPVVDRPAVKEFAAASAAPAPAVVPMAVCRKCGCDLVDDEQFCGECGSPRTGDYEPVSMQSKVAMLWQMQEAKKKGAAPPNGSPGVLDPFPPESSDADLLVSGLPELFTLPRTANHDVEELEAPEPIEESANEDSTISNAEVEAAEAEPSTEITLVKPEPAADWSSATAARAFLEQLVQTDRHAALTRFLKARRGDIYLAIAVILVAVAIRWGIWSGHAVSATGTPVAAAAAHRKPGADLPLFDRMLIKLGLAEAPDPPENKGNPNAQVWVDVQTALYYCPGADLYGKTPKGKLSSQRDAQLDSYEPAYRKACD